MADKRKKTPAKRAPATRKLRALRNYAAQRGWTVTMQVKEVGSVGSRRQMRENLIEALQRRGIDLVLV
jgi:DNA invertase Pin-like site-specific DNA recombinase